jgi:hypothetical protein
LQNIIQQLQQINQYNGVVMNQNLGSSENTGNSPEDIANINIIQNLNESQVQKIVGYLNSTTMRNFTRTDIYTQYTNKENMNDLISLLNNRDIQGAKNQLVKIYKTTTNKTKLMMIIQNPPQIGGRRTYRKKNRTVRRKTHKIRRALKGKIL